jgi:2-dehydro-3-deoxy-D-gluconate 5-dehydrogenase
MNLFEPKGNRVVITGGVGGIGRALVQGFIDAGTDVLVSARDASQFEELKKFLQENNSPAEKLHYVAADFSDLDQARTFLDKARAILGGVDILIIAHGGVKPGPAIETNDETWIEQLQINLTSYFQLARAAAPEMIERGSGKIITIASMLTFQGGLNASTYAAAKGGVGQLTKALSNEWAKFGVNVNAIAPGYIQTKLNRHIWTDPVRNEQILARLTSGRWGEPGDLVGPTLFLASRASDYMHGVVMPVDGGWLSR